MSNLQYMLLFVVSLFAASCVGLMVFSVIVDGWRSE